MGRRKPTEMDVRIDALFGRIYECEQNHDQAGLLLCRDEVVEILESNSLTILQACQCVSLLYGIECQLGQFEHYLPFSRRLRNRTDYESLDRFMMDEMSVYYASALLTSGHCDEANVEFQALLADAKPPRHRSTQLASIFDEMSDRNHCSEIVVELQRILAENHRRSKAWAPLKQPRRLRF